jgi:hypothetical protein
VLGRDALRAIKIFAHIFALLYELFGIFLVKSLSFDFDC